MGRGGYLGGSTVVGPNSDWFSKPEVGPRLSVEEKKKNQLEWAQRNTWAKAEQLPAEKKAQEKGERIRLKQAEQENRRKLKAKKLREEAERLKTDPEYIALKAEKLRKEQERIARVVVVVQKPKKRVLRDGD
jgi:hypothetical protein